MSQNFLLQYEGNKENLGNSIKGGKIKIHQQTIYLIVCINHLKKLS